MSATLSAGLRILQQYPVLVGETCPQKGYSMYDTKLNLLVRL